MQDKVLPRLFRMWLMTLFCLFASNVLAQNLSLENQIINEIEQVENNSTITDEEKKKVLEDLQEALNFLNKAQEQFNLVSTYEKQANNASQKLISLQANADKLDKTQVKIENDTPIDELENKLLLSVSERKSVLDELKKKQAQQTALSLRANKIVEELNVTRADKTAIADALVKKPNEDLNPAAQAIHLKQQANLIKLNAIVSSLERELVTIPARQTIVDAELVQLRKQQQLLETRIEKLRSLLSDRLENQVEQTIEANSSIAEKLEEQPLLAPIAQENLLLAKRLKQIQEGSSDSAANMDLLRSQLLEVQQSSGTVERVLATGRVTDELGELLRKIRARLPKESVIVQRKTQLEEDAIRHQLDVILWQERLRNLVDIPQSAKRLLEQNSAELSVESTNEANDFSVVQLTEAEALVQSRIELLRNLIDVSNSQSDQIIEEKLTINQLLLASTELRELLQRRLIWLPSNSGKAGNLGVNLQDSMSWFLSPNSWLKLLNNFYNGILTVPAVPFLLCALALLILAVRQKIKRALSGLVDRVGSVSRDTYFTTPYALLLTFTLALPLPLLLFSIATLIYKGTDTSNFSTAIAAGLMSVSTLSLILLFFRSMSRTNGVFSEHFNWSDRSRKKLSSMLTWFVWLQSLVTFTFVTAITSDETELRYGIAIIAFIIGSINISFFSYQFFTPKKGVANNIVSDSPAGSMTTIAFPIVVLAPLVIGLLPLFGFFDTAVELQSKLFLSGILLVFAAVIYGIVIRIFLVAFRRYIFKKEQQEAAEALAAKQKAQAQSAEENASQEAQDAKEGKEDEEKSIDKQDVKRQTQSIILWTISLLFIIGLWFIWNPLLPALGIVDDIVLWQTVKVVDGVELSSGVTLWNIILAVALVIGGIVAAKNIRGIMEIGLFERVKMDSGARYAIITILGYVLVGTGIVVGFSQLGIDWSKLQWIIAALGVGLGFGLQEIVANFVSGLIILFERPIRVGDFVTIGNLSGTVSNIKIRATTVTDFDNREVLLPNKSIITENVTNWTLKDAVTRVVIEIGVAYGSDIKKVRSLLQEVIEKQNEVLDFPAPQVFFLEHGDSSLNFEMRVFVDRPEERFPLTHSINSAVNQVLKDNDISIPFPQRDLHIVSGHLPKASDED